MTDPQISVALGDPVAYSVGLMYASVCTGWDDDQTTRWLNLSYPTGISSQWSVSADATFAGGAPNPSPCEQDPCRRHVLFSC